MRIGLGAVAQPLISPGIVGRNTELGILGQVVEQASTGVGRVLVLIGEPGIGKTRLCRETFRLARERGLTVLAGRAVEAGAPEPFRPVSEALARARRDGLLPDDSRLTGALPALGHLVPHWPAAVPEEPSLVEISEALLSLLSVASADGGVLLTVEDLHWSDDETLGVLEYLADNVDDHGALVLATARPESTSRAVQLVRRLADRRAATIMELGPLRDNDVDQLVLGCLGADAVPEPVLSFVRSHADGVPFFVEELLAGLARSGAIVRDDEGAWQLAGRRLAPTVPSSLADSIGHRLTQLRDDARRVLEGAALLGRRFDWRLLPEVTGVADDSVQAALREAADVGLVVGDGDEIGFRHALIRDRVLEAALPSDRVSIGARAISAIEHRHPGLPGGWCELVAELAELANDPRLAARCLREVAQRARRRGALATALLRLEHARSIVDEPDLRLVLDEELAEVLALAGEVDAAQRLAERALAMREERGDRPERVAELSLVLGRAALAAGRHELAREYANAARDSARRLGDGDRELRAASLAALVAVSAGETATAVRLAQQVLGSAGDALPAVQCEAYEVLGRCARLHDVARAEQAFASGLAVAERHGLRLWQARALHELGTIDLYDRMRTDRLEAARRAAIETGAPATVAAADLHLAWAWVARGHTAKAREAAERAVALARRLDLSVLPAALVVLARTFAQERRRDRVEQTVAEIRRIAPDDPGVEAVVAGHVDTMLALHAADRRAALEALDRATALLRSSPAEHFPHWGLWALMRAVDGDDSARAEAAIAAGSDTRFNRALLHAALGVTSGRRGAGAAASREIELAVATLRGYEDADWLVHLTGWLVAPAALRDGWGDPVTWLQAAVRWFGAHGYDPLARSCRALLREVRAPVPREGRGSTTVPDSLRAVGVTSREMDVLALLGARLTNRDIAERLVLSPRTVEKHVASLLLKTGSANRAALAQLAESTRDIRPLPGDVSPPSVP